MLCTSEPLILLPWRWFGGGDSSLALMRTYLLHKSEGTRKRGEIHRAQANSGERMCSATMTTRIMCRNKQHCILFIHELTHTCYFKGNMLLFFTLIYLADPFIYSDLYFVIYSRRKKLRETTPNFSFK